MHSYLNILSNIFKNGKSKLPERKLENGRKLSNSTIGIPNVVFSHSMGDGFPLLTTKRISLRNVAVELEGFIKGITDKQWYKERGCNIWNEWANPKRVTEAGIEAAKNGEFFIRQRAQEQINDLGPIYGSQWRSFDGQADQLKNIVDTLKNNPNDRRMICSAWNPNKIGEMALPPCHYSWGVTVYDGKLNMMVTIRSWDFFLGAGYNIASYALLLMLLSKESNFEPNNLTIIGLDAHLYDNQFEQVEEQLKREPFKLPTVKITGNSSIFEWTYKDFELKDYNHHKALSKVKVVV